MTNRLIVTLAAWLVLAPMGAQAQTAGPTSFDDTPDASPTATSDSSSAACYYQKTGAVKWKWGLNDDNSWYSITGVWKKTTYTKILKFFAATATLGDFVQACENAARYYRLTGWDHFATFAATSGIGYNYPLVDKDGKEAAATSE